MHLKHLSLKMKLILMTLLMVLAVISTQAVVNFRDIAKQKRDLLHRESRNYERFMDIVNQCSEENMRIALAIAHMDSIHMAMKKKDKTALLNLIKPLNDLINHYSKFSYHIHFHEPGSISFLRVWRPDKNGDALAGFRMTLNEVQKTKKPVHGIEAGRGGLVVRGLAPILDGDQLLGSVEVYCNINQIADSLDNANAIYGLEKVKATASQSFHKLGKFNVLKSPPKEIPSITEAFLNRALNNCIIQESGDVLLATSPVTDYKDQIVGVYVQILDIQAIKAAIRSNIIIMVVVACLLIVVSSFFTFLLSKSITHPIQRIIDGLSASSDQVDISSRQISAVSNTLADGSSSQAASIEETSSSIEEMSSMTQNNADNATHADNLMHTANGIVERAHQSMGALTISMQEITTASEEISDIIKTIDEIAFQTNLLALNAAVEAARAGESGAGFAVVADEVRNLAMRSAEAAKNTSALIEGTVQKINNGAELVQTTHDNFNEVVENTRKVGELLEEIARASDEQAKGITQVNRAVSEMDKVVQKNAAIAEENSSAAMDMSLEATRMKEFVINLALLIRGHDAAGQHVKR